MIALPDCPPPGNAVLSDFGLAKLLTETAALTQTGTVLGTPTYMAPEIWSGQTVDARTDIYAVGIMLFEMLSGKLPFQADTPYHMMHLHIYEPPPSVRRLRADLPPGTDRVLAKVLAKDREQRFQSAGELASSFNALLAAAQSRPGKTDPGTPAAKPWVIS